MFVAKALTIQPHLSKKAPFLVNSMFPASSGGASPSIQPSGRHIGRSQLLVTQTGHSSRSAKTSDVQITYLIGTEFI